MKANIKLTPALLRELAADVFLNLSAKELAEVSAIEKNILHRFEKVSAINTDNVAPLIYPFEQARTYLRDDESEPVVVDQSTVLANAVHTQGPYVVLARVIK